MSLSQAQKDAGYSDSYAESDHITTTKTWRKLLEATLSDDLLLKTHKAGLEATQKTYASFRGDISDEREDPDHTNRSRYLDFAYKLKGKYAPEQHEVTTRRTLDEVEDEIATTLLEIGEVI